MGKSLRVAYGEALVKLGAKNEKVVALDADLAHATMSATFAAAYPDRFYNMGIAEANMMCAAAGFAHTGIYRLQVHLRCSVLEGHTNRLEILSVIQMQM